MTDKASNKGTSTTAFLLEDDELAELEGKRGRKATDSEYLAEVDEALAHRGDVYGIKCAKPGDTNPATPKAAWVAAQIRKGFKQREIDIKFYTVYNREEKGFVAFVAKPEEAPAE
jgi:hypothetical protein